MNNILNLLFCICYISGFIAYASAMLFIAGKASAKHSGMAIKWSASICIVVILIDLALKAIW